MKNKIFFFSFVFVLTQLSVVAQNYSFKVLVNKGKNEVKSGNNWNAIKVGASLSEKDEIKVGSNAYIGLVHVTGKPLELKEENTYKVADLAKKISTGSSVLTKYTDFILSSNTTAKNNMNATGAVHRGPKELKVYLPTVAAQAVFYNSHQVINWDNEGLKGPFTVTFSTLFEDELKRIKTSENTVTIDLSSSEFQNEDNIMVIVTADSDAKQSAKYTLKRLSKSDKIKIENLLQEISSSTADETALNKFILAGFYEENNLLIDAATNYLDAIKLAPEVAEYKQYYHDFLLRTGVKTLEKK
jgi:hypothetical protein